MCEISQPDLDISVGCSTETLFEEKKPAVPEENQFEYRHVSIMLALFGSFGVSGL